MIVKLPPSAGQFTGDESNLLGWMEDNRREFGDIYRASIFGASVYVVCEPKYVHHVLRKNWQNYRKGLAIRRIAMLLGKGLMVSEGALWKTQRRMIQPAFHETVIAQMTDNIRAANASLLERWEQAAQDVNAVNVTRDISRMTLEITLKAIFGDDYCHLAPHFNILAAEPARTLQFAHAFRSLGTLIGQVIYRRRNNHITLPDILGILLEARDRDSGQCMSDRQLVDEILTLVVAGHETTASTLNWIWYLLSQNPEVEKKLNVEASRGSEVPAGFSYSRQVIEEALRLYPAGWLMTRRALNDDKLGDYFVAARTEIYLSPYIIQRHPDLWRDPNRFDPDRFDPVQSAERHPLAMLAFSAGPRNCIGENLARLEMQMNLCMIASKLRLRCLDCKPLELDLGVNLRSKHDFIMLPSQLPLYT